MDWDIEHFLNHFVQSVIEEEMPDVTEHIEQELDVVLAEIMGEE